MKDHKEGSAVTVVQDGEHYGKIGIIKEVAEGECLVRIPSDGEYFTRLWFDKGDLK